MNAEERKTALAEWWQTFDGPAYPTGSEVADALAPLVEQWIAESNTAAAADVLTGDETALGAAAGFHYHSGRRDGAAAVVARVQAAKGWVPDPDEGEPFIYASDLRAALASEEPTP